MKELLNKLWVEEFRPQTLEGCILPERTKKEFQEFVNAKFIPNLILSGSTGTGKSSTAKAVLNDIGADYIVINGSKDLGIDTLRTTIQQFASTVSLVSDNNRKYVLIEEADWMNANSVQPALRAFIEEFSDNCGFIFTCNYPNKIMKELRGRCTEVKFKVPGKEVPSIAAQNYKRVCSILDIKGITYEKEVVAQYVKQTFPDLRRCIGDMQRFAIHGSIDSGIFAIVDANWEELFGYLKTKNFNNMRKWVALNSNIDSTSLYRYLFDELPIKITHLSIPTLILTLAEYQFKSSLVVDQEINNTACLTELMSSIEFL